MSYTKHYHHIIFGTKHRKKVLERQYLPMIHSAMADKIKRMKCHVILINGVEDHVHILCSVHPAVAVSDLVKRVKIDSSIYIKENFPLMGFTNWAKRYTSITFHKSLLQIEYNYVKNQWEHHHKVSSRNEEEAVLRANDIDYDPEHLEKEE